MTTRKYETKRLDCWQRAKELREGYYRDCWTAKEKGRILGAGVGMARASVIPAALSNCQFAELEGYAANLVANGQLAIQCAEAAEAREYLNDLCGSSRILLGSMFLNQGPFGEFIKPDFCLQMHVCATQGKRAQIISEHLGIPYFCVEVPLVNYQTKREFHFEFLISQMQDAIQWMEKVTGSKLDDEKLIEGVRNGWQASVLWARSCELNKSTPAPLDQRMLFSLSGPLMLKRHEKETLDFYQIVYDEVRDRVQNGIAALATERYRLLHEGQPPWFFLRLFKHIKEYGAVCIGSMYDFGTGAFERQADGSWVVAQTPEERGMKLKTREDALRALAELYLSNPTISSFLLTTKVEDEVKVAQDWHADGVLFHFNRGCRACSSGLAEAELAFDKRGIRTAFYEADACDRRGFSEAQVMGRIESFLESLGLARLED